VLFPLNASYTETGTIAINGRNDLIIDGHGSTFTRTSPPVDNVWKPQWQIRSCTDIVIQNMTIVGAWTPNVPRGPTAGNQFEPGINFAGCNGMTIRDVNISRVFGEFILSFDGIWPNSLTNTNVRIERVTGTSAARQGLGIEAVVNAWVTDNTLNDLHYAGISLEQDIPGQAVQNVHVLRNTINGVWGVGVAVPLKGHGEVRDIEISDNVMLTPGSGCLPAVQITYPPNNIGNPQMVAGITIERNSLKALHHGIELTDVASGSVRNNIVEAVGAPLCGPGRLPVSLNNSPNVVVSGNTGIGY
jgi:parallel beta helix pectate lyase-like protein